MSSRTRRAAAALVVGAAVLAVASAPARPGPAPVTYRPVRSALLACPELGVAGGSAAVLSGLVAPGSGSVGTGALRTIEGGKDLAELQRPGMPVSLVAASSQPTILMTAAGEWASGALAGVATRTLAGPAAGLASISCAEPASEWWFVGPGSQVGRGDALLVSNPSEEPARVDITLYARSGPIGALAGKGIDMAPLSQARLRLDALAPDQPLLAVHVRARNGRVAVAVRDVAVPVAGQPQGGDFVPPTLPPARRVVVGSVPGGAGGRDLVVVNPGDQFATMRVRQATRDGLVDLPGNPALAVPAGSVVQIPLAGPMAGRTAALVVESDVAVAAAVRVSLGTSRREVSWVAAVPAVAAPNSVAGAAAVPAGPGLTTTVTVAAPGAAVSGLLSVLTTGTAGQAPLAAGGPPASDRRDRGRRPPTVLADPGSLPAQIPVDVPAGSVRSVSVPGTSGAAVAHLVWRSAPASGPALVSHLTEGRGPLATGYAWWPVTAAVAAAAVREDVGTLAPAG